MKNTVYPPSVIERFPQPCDGEVQQITEAGQLRVWFDATTWFARLDQSAVECTFQPGEKVRILGMEDSTTLLVMPLSENTPPQTPRRWFDWSDNSDSLAYV